MEVGKIKLFDWIIKFDLVDVMIQGVDLKVFDFQSDQVECFVCLICGFCFGMFIVNLMNCLIEVLGLLQLGNGLLLVIYVDCKQLFFNVGKCIVELIKCYYE